MIEPTEILKDHSEVKRYNPRLANLIESMLPKIKTATCIYCRKEYDKGTDDYEFVRKYGYCVGCDDLNNEYKNDAYIELQSLSEAERKELLEDYDETLTDKYRD